MCGLTGVDIPRFEPRLFTIARTIRLYGGNGSHMCGIQRAKYRRPPHDPAGAERGEYHARLRGTSLRR